MSTNTGASDYDDRVLQGKLCDRSWCEEQATETLEAAKPQGGTMTFCLCEDCHEEVAP